MPTKENGGNNKPWPLEVRAEALRLYREVGRAEAVRRTGVPGPTISYWAKQEGELGAGPNKDNTPVQLTKAWVDKSNARKQTLAERLLDIAELATDEEIRLILAGASSLRDVVGARTRAIHDAQLLLGEATERLQQVGLGESEATRDGLVAAKLDELAQRRAQRLAAGGESGGDAVAALPAG